MISARVDTSIETYSGVFIDYLNPRPQDIELVDIAHALAYTCRFGGHCDRFYSVAEHAVRVAKLVSLQYPELELAALHHDSHEAYLGDWPTPLKRAIDATFVTRLQANFDEAICARFDICPMDLHTVPVKMADQQALLAEAATLKPSQGLGVHWGTDRRAEPIAGAGLSPELAERLFIDTHERAMRGSSR